MGDLRRLIEQIDPSCARERVRAQASGPLLRIPRPEPGWLSICPLVCAAFPSGRHHGTEFARGCSFREKLELCRTCRHGCAQLVVCPSIRAEAAGLSPARSITGRTFLIRERRKPQAEGCGHRPFSFAPAALSAVSELIVLERNTLPVTCRIQPPVCSADV